MITDALDLKHRITRACRVEYNPQSAQPVRRISVPAIDHLVADIIRDEAETVELVPGVTLPPGWQPLAHLARATWDDGKTWYYAVAVEGE